MKRFARWLSSSCLLALGVAVAPLAGAQTAPAQPAAPIQPGAPMQPGPARPRPAQPAAPTFAVPRQPGPTARPGEQPERGRRGMMRIFEDALEQVGLRPDQRAAVEQLKEDSAARHAPVRAAKQDLMQALAAQMRTGSVDRCALEPQIRVVAAAWERAHAGDHAAMEQLHSILDPDQRARFADALRQGLDAAMRSHDSGAWLDKMSSELQLTADQRERIERVLRAERDIREADPKSAEWRDRANRVLEAFKGERFVMSELVPSSDVAERTKAMMDSALCTVEAVLPILTPQQRRLAADKLLSLGRAQPGAPGAGQPGYGPGAQPGLTQPPR